MSFSSWFDISNRSTVRDSWNLTFAPTSTVPTGWTGSVDANDPGTTTQAFKDAVATRVNWFRAMAGVPPSITIDPTFSAKDQKAALMFSANRSISHTPPATWVDYSVDGAQAAGNSNICYGFYNDPGCVAAYIVDSGSNNTVVGHRRWILYPQTHVMGTGDVPQSGPDFNPYPPANALWVFDGNYGTTRPATRDDYVAWPPPGYVPYQVIGPRWSFSYPNADFSGASVSMTRNGQSVPVQLSPVTNGYGENTIVWVPDNQNPDGFNPVAPAADTTSVVTLTNVLVGGSARSFQYPVTVFDPATTSNASFSFSPSSQSIGASATSGTANLGVSPSTATWTAISSAPWLTITSATSGMGSASIAWSALANTSSSGRSATIIASGAVFTVTQAAMPSAISVSPSSGSGAAQAFSGVYTAPAGYRNLRWVQMLFAIASDGGGQSYCFIHYDVQGNGFWLYGDGGFFVGPIAPGAASNTLQNSLCALNTSGSTATGSGTTLVIQPNVVFKQPGTRNIYLRAMDLVGDDTGWIQRGSWTHAAASLNTLTVNPSSGTGSTATFTATYPDPSGFAGAPVGWVQLLIAAASDGGGQPFCFVHYDRAGNGLWMYSSQLGYFLGPVAPGTASNALNSSACSVNTAAATVTNTGGNLVLSVPVTLKPPMSGAKKIFQRTLDVLNRDTGWQQTGFWTIP